MDEWIDRSNNHSTRNGLLMNIAGTMWCATVQFGIRGNYSLQLVLPLIYIYVHTKTYMIVPVNAAINQKCNKRMLRPWARNVIRQQSSRINHTHKMGTIVFNCRTHTNTHTHTAYRVEVECCRCRHCLLMMMMMMLVLLVLLLSMVPLPQSKTNSRSIYNRIVLHCNIFTFVVVVVVVRLALPFPICLHLFWRFGQALVIVPSIVMVSDVLTSTFAQWSRIHVWTRSKKAYRKYGRTRIEMRTFDRNQRFWGGQL